MRGVSATGKGTSTLNALGTHALHAAAMLCICGLAIGTACVAGSAAPRDSPADRAPTTGAPTSEAPQRASKPQPKATSNPTKVSERGEGGGAGGDAGGGGEPNYGNALVVRARDFPDGLSGTIMCEGFVIPAGELIILGADLVIESSGPIIINGDLIGGAPWDGLDGVNIVLESTEFIRITGLVQPGDGLSSTETRIPGGRGGDLVLRAPLTETTQAEFRAGDGGDGAVAANGGHGGSVLLSGQGVMYDLVEFPQGNPERNFAVRGGNGGLGGAGTARFGTVSIHGADGGNGGDASVLSFEPANWMEGEMEGRDDEPEEPDGPDGSDGSDYTAPLTAGQDGLDSLYPCQKGNFGYPGPGANAGHGTAGGPGSNATSDTPAGVGGRGGSGGTATSAQGGKGGRGGDCCGPRGVSPFGAGGKGGAGGDGGVANGGNGANGGPGGNGHPDNPSGGNGGPGGNGGMANGGYAGRGGPGGHGTTPGVGGTGASGGDANGGSKGMGGEAARKRRVKVSKGGSMVWVGRMDQPGQRIPVSPAQQAMQVTSARSDMPTTMVKHSKPTLLATTPPVPAVVPPN